MPPPTTPDPDPSPPGPPPSPGTVTTLRATAIPPGIQAAVRHIHTRPGDPITITDLAQIAGMPYRRFTGQFRRAMGVTAMTYLRRVRMAGAHTDLAAADPARTTVTDIATRWGLLHLSRFARDYNRVWGEYPSTTLHRPAGDLADGRRIPDRVGIRVHRRPAAAKAS